MLCIVCMYLMNPSLYTVQYRPAGHRQRYFLGKDDSCDSTLAIYILYMNYLSMLSGKSWLKKNNFN